MFRVYLGTLLMHASVKQLLGMLFSFERKVFFKNRKKEYLSIQVLVEPIDGLLFTLEEPLFIDVVLFTHGRTHTEAVHAAVVHSELVRVSLWIGATGLAHLGSQCGLDLFGLGLVELHVVGSHGHGVGDLELFDGVDDHLRCLDNVTWVTVELGVDESDGASVVGATTSLPYRLGRGLDAQLRAGPRAPTEPADAQFAPGRQVGLDAAGVTQDLWVHLLRVGEDHEGDGLRDEGDGRVDLGEDPSDGPGRVGSQDDVHFVHEGRGHATSVLYNSFTCQPS